jgi:hypothetical protein
MGKSAGGLDLSEIIDILDTCINSTTVANLHETTELLRIARLDILMRANGITEEELEYFLFAIEHMTIDSEPFERFPSDQPYLPSDAG